MRDDVSGSGRKRTLQNEIITRIRQKRPPLEIDVSLISHGTYRVQERRDLLGCVIGKQSRAVQDVVILQAQRRGNGDTKISQRQTAQNRVRSTERRPQSRHKNISIEYDKHGSVTASAVDRQATTIG